MPEEKITVSDQKWDINAIVKSGNYDRDNILLETVEQLAYDLARSVRLDLHH